MNTHFASHQRASIEQIHKEYSELKSVQSVKELLGALPYITAILNKDRQILFSNDALLSKSGVGNMEEILGLRPGEALNCIHSGTMKAGCGTSPNCQVCGAVNTILECQKTGKTAKGECRIRTSKGKGSEDCLDLEVTATPFLLNEHQFIIFVARDISSEKRKEALERIFFHDVINTAGTLQGIVDLLQQINDPVKIKQFVELLATVSHDLTEEIQNQKSLLAAENGELVVKKRKIYLKETLDHIVKEYRRNELGLNKKILFADEFCEVTINTDPVILKRVIRNMIKNALEAISIEEKVNIECVISSATVCICVQNPGEMPDSIKKQIFQRSFSTKGKGRGLGTYSMKLLGERYLEGKISFSSTKKGGTEFKFELPLSPD